jgi:hypothetical protein
MAGRERLLQSKSPPDLKVGRAFVIRAAARLTLAAVLEINTCG